MSEKISSLEKIPTPILLIFVVISPFLSNIFLTSDMDLLLGISGLIVFGVALIITIILYFWMEERRQDRILKEKELSNKLAEKKLEYDTKKYEINALQNQQSVQTYAKVFGQFFVDTMNKIVEDPEYAQKLQEFSDMQKTKQE